MAPAPLAAALTISHALEALHELSQVLKKGVHAALQRAPKGTAAGAGAALKEAAQLLELLRGCGGRCVCGRRCQAGSEQRWTA